MNIYSLEIGQEFKLNTTRYYLKNHIYKVVSKDEKGLTYMFSAHDRCNQKTIVPITAKIGVILV